MKSNWTRVLDEAVDLINKDGTFGQVYVDRQVGGGRLGIRFAKDEMRAVWSLNPIQHPEGGRILESTVLIELDGPIVDNADSKKGPLHDHKADAVSAQVINDAFKEAYVMVRTPPV